MNKVREARQYHLALILLGVCLADESQREEVLESLSRSSVKSERFCDVLDAVRDKDVETVDEFFERMNVHRTDGEKYHHAIIRRLTELHEQDTISTAVQSLVDGDAWTFETAEQKWQGVKDMLEYHKQQTFDKPKD